MFQAMQKYMSLSMESLPLKVSPCKSGFKCRFVTLLILSASDQLTHHHGRGDTTVKSSLEFVYHFQHLLFSKITMKTLNFDEWF